jgi:hypothetical protein
VNEQVGRDPFRRLDGADLGDLESDPFVQQNDKRLNVHAHR